MRRTSRFFATAGLLLGMLTSAPALAAGIFQLNDIYQARVPVPEQSQAALDKAFPAALAKVLVRVTGQADALSAHGMASVMRQAGSLVQSYRYIQQAGKQPSGQDKQKLVVQVRFDDHALNQRIRAHGLPVWGRERPQTLIWLGVRGDGQRAVVAADDASNAAAGLVNTALARGVPVIFPLMDLQDQRKVRDSDVWGGFFDSLENAAQRYPQTDMLVVDAQQTRGQWQSHWTLLQQGKISARWSASGENLNGALRRGTNELATRYAKRYAARGTKSAAKTLHLVIGGVRDASDYARVSQYLNGLTAVESLQLEAVNDQHLIFNVKTASSRAYVRRVMSLAGLFSARKSRGATGGGESRLPPTRVKAGTDTTNAPSILEFTLKPDTDGP